MWETYLVEVDAHTLELELGGSVVDTIAVEAVLARDGLPESSTDLVTLQKREWPEDDCETSRGREYLRTGRSGGEPVIEEKKIVSFWFSDITMAAFLGWRWEATGEGGNASAG